jgi:hypothetical protein
VTAHVPLQTVVTAEKAAALIAEQEARLQDDDSTISPAEKEKLELLLKYFKDPENYSTLEFTPVPGILITTSQYKCYETRTSTSDSIIG